MKKKGVSQVVSTVILVALTISLIGGIWSVINGFVGDKLDDAEACNDLFEKVVLNPEYICYNSTSNSTMVSISRQDIELDSLMIIISNLDSSQSVLLTSKVQILDNVFNISTSIPGVKMPGKEEGQTYCIKGIEIQPTQIEIAPKRNGKQCESVDSVSKILQCTQGGC